MSLMEDSPLSSLDVFREGSPEEIAQLFNLLIGMVQDLTRKVEDLSHLCGATGEFVDRMMSFHQALENHPMLGGMLAAQGIRL